MKNFLLNVILVSCVCMIYGQNWEHLSADTDIQNVTAIEYMPGQGLLIGTLQGMYKYVNDNFFVMVVGTATNIRDLHLDPTGGLWVASYQGLFRWLPGVGTTHYTTADGLPSNEVNCVISDGTQAWVGTQNGFSVFDGINFTTYNVGPGTENRIADVAKDNNNVVWVASFLRLSKYENFNFTTFNDTIPFGTSGNIEIHTLTNDLYLTYGKKFAVRQGGVISILFETPQIIIKSLSYVENENKMLFIDGSLGYVYDFSGSVPSNNIMVPENINTIFNDNNYIYLGGANGVYRNNFNALYCTRNDTIDYGNFKALINADGDFFWDKVTQVPVMRFPKDSLTNTIFLATLWMGGYNQNDVLSVAGQRYSQVGRDYWAGPVTSQYTSDYDSKFYHVWKLHRTEINNHILNYNNPGYTMPWAIEHWPAHGNVVYGQAPLLAPFYDANQNGIYDPENGDYPVIFGEQAAYIIFNDTHFDHTESGGNKIGAEVHAMAFVMEEPNDEILKNTLFVQYNIFNRLDNDFSDFYFGLQVDFDLGYFWDDFLGCDTTLHTFYAYNGKVTDGAPSPYHYGPAPPVQGVTFINKELSSFFNYNNTAGNMGDPQTAEEYYGYMQGYWRDGTPIVYGGNGHHSSVDDSIPTNYMYPGNPLDSAQWSEVSVGNVPHDIRGLGSIGVFDFLSGTNFPFDIAYVYNRDCDDSTLCDNLSNIPTFLNDVEHVRNSKSTIGVAMQNTVFIANDIPVGNYNHASAIIYNTQLNYNAPIDSVVLVNATDGQSGEVITDWKIYQEQNIIELSDIKYITPGNQPVLLYLSLILNPNMKSMVSYTIKYYSPGLTSINEYTLSDINIYPNPAQAQLHINFNNLTDLPANLTIYSITGTLVKQQKLYNNRNVMDISALHGGLYIVNVRSSNGFTNKKLIKQ